MKHKIGSGLRTLPDTFLLATIEKLRQQGFTKTSDLVDELTDRFGGELLDDAFRLRDMARDSGLGCCGGPDAGTVK